MGNNHSKRFLFAGIFALGLSAMFQSLDALAQYSSVGDPFQVNLPSPKDQASARVAIASNGNFVVVWDSEEQDGNGLSVIARLFSSTGEPLTGEIPVNVYTVSDQMKPAVDINTQTGDFVVVWESRNEAGATSGMDVYARCFDAQGQPVTDPFLVNETMEGNQIDLEVSIASSSGNFVIVWTQSTAGNPSAIRFRLFDAKGKSLTGELQANETNSADHFSPNVKMNETGNFTIGWTALLNQQYDILLQRYDAKGMAIGAAIQANADENYDRLNFNIDINVSGEFIMVWDSLQSGTIAAYARGYYSNGAPMGNEFKVNQNTTEGNAPNVALSDAGKAVIAWDTVTGNQNDLDVYIRMINVDGSAGTNESRVNSYSVLPENLPDVDITPDGMNVVVTWNSIDSTNHMDVYGRVYAYDADHLGFETGIEDFMLHP